MEIEKRKFYRHKNLILINDVDIDKIYLSNEVSCKKALSWL